MSVTYGRLNGAEARAIYDELYGLFMDVYGDTGDPFYEPERVHDQLRSHFAVPGLDMVTAKLDGELVGYVYGFPRKPDAPWWNDVKPLPGVDLSPRAKRPTFAVCELMVAEPHRGKGVGRELHHTLMSGRSDDNGTLLVLPNNQRARATYERWGWRQIGRYRPSVWQDAPTFEAMLLELPFRSNETQQPKRPIFGT